MCDSPGRTQGVPVRARMRALTLHQVRYAWASAPLGERVPCPALIHEGSVFPQVQHMPAPNTLTRYSIPGRARNVMSCARLQETLIDDGSKVTVVMDVLEIVLSSSVYPSEWLFMLRIVVDSYGLCRDSETSCHYCIKRGARTCKNWGYEDWHFKV